MSDITLLGLICIGQAIFILFQLHVAKRLYKAGMVVTGMLLDQVVGKRKFELTETGLQEVKGQDNG